MRIVGFSKMKLEKSSRRVRGSLSGCPPPLPRGLQGKKVRMVIKSIDSELLLHDEGTDHWISQSPRGVQGISQSSHLSD